MQKCGIGLLLAFCLLAAPACSPSKGHKDASSADEGEKYAHAKPVNGDWLIQHLLSDPEQLNPLTSNDATASAILGRIFEPLLDRDPETLSLRPLLAKELPEVAPDHLSYTFRLRNDARFSDGKPVTIDDVLFSIKAIKCPLVDAPFLRVYYASVVDARRVDDSTVLVTTSEPYFLNDNVLGGISVLPRHYYDPNGDLNGLSVREVAAAQGPSRARIKKFADHFNSAFARNPMGSGPYRFSEWKTGERVVLERNPGYWGYAHEEIESPHIDRLVYRIVNNTDAALVTLKSGDLDVMSLDPLQHLRQTSGSRFEKEFGKLTYYSPGYTYIGWNNHHPIFKDPRVRRAMTMLTDRQGMVKTILFDLGSVIDSPIYRFRPEYDEHLTPPPFDPKGALALLREAGWADTDQDGILDKVIDGKKTPLSFEIKINSGNEIRKSVALTLQDEFKKHGIQVQIREVDWTIFLNDVKHRQFNAVILGWAMGVDPPDAYQVWHSSQIENGGSNYIGYRNARVDAILETYRKEFDEPKRVALYREFQEILNQDQPYTFLFMGKSILAYSRRFQNVAALPIGGVDTYRWWVPEALQKYHGQGQGQGQAPAP